MTVSEQRMEMSVIVATEYRPHPSDTVSVSPYLAHFFQIYVMGKLGTTRQSLARIPVSLN